MEEFELDENGYKKSKLSLEDFNDPKYSEYILARQENASMLKHYWEEPENKERLREHTRQLGLKSKESGQVAKNMAAGRYTQWVTNYDERLKAHLEMIENYGPEERAKMAAGGSIGGKKRQELGILPGQLEALEEYRDPQKAADARQTITCTVCGKEGLTGNINRWHNDNCKIAALKESANKHLPDDDFRFFDIPDQIKAISIETKFTEASVIGKLKQYKLVEKTKTKGRFKKLSK